MNFGDALLYRVRYTWFVFLYWCYHIAWRLGLYIPPEKKKTVLEQDSTFYTQKMDRFKKLLEKTDIDKNTSIVSVFYDREEFQKMVSNMDNQLEKIWKTRVYYINTPRGPISMHYDAFKMAFSYYCDQSVVSYDVLNACAMDYVRMFSCLDFFQDELILEELKQPMSPLHKIHYKEEENQNKNDKNDDNNNKNNNNNNKKDNKTIKSKAFYAQQTNNNRNSMTDYFQQRFANMQSMEKKPPNKLTRNRFVHLGKMCNWSVLQPIAKKTRVLPAFKSAQLEGIITDSTARKFSWQDYKKMTQNKPIDGLTDTNIETNNDNKTNETNET